MKPSDTLQSIQDWITQADTLTVIEQFMPRTLTNAISWVRCLPFWEEHKGQFTERTIALARIISRRTMREYGLKINEDGRVVESKKQSPIPNEQPTLAFTVTVAGQPVEVKYTRSYFPMTDTDDFSFHAKPNPLSETGYWHTFAPHDAVQAAGGPEAFTRLYVDAKLTDREKEFMEQFQGRFPEAKRPARKSKKPVLGEHTAAVVEEQIVTEAAERIEEPEKPGQGELFA